MLPTLLPAPTEQSIGDLVRAWLDRADQRAASELHRRMQPCLRSVIARFPSLAAEADDLAQQISIRTFQALGRLDVTRPLWPWLQTLAQRHCLDRLGSADFRASGLRTELPSHHPAPTVPPDEVVYARERTQAVRRAVTRLAPADRRVLELAHLDELPLTAAAALLGCAPGALKVRAHRARHRLRAAWLRNSGGALAA